MTRSQSLKRNTSRSSSRNNNTTQQHHNQHETNHSTNTPTTKIKVSARLSKKRQRSKQLLLDKEESPSHHPKRSRSKSKSRSSITSNNTNTNNTNNTNNTTSNLTHRNQNQTQTTSPQNQLQLQQYQQQQELEQTQFLQVLHQKDAINYDIYTDTESSAIHWNPQSHAGTMVGYRFRMYNETLDTWRPGRVLHYDVLYQRHYVRFYAPENEETHDRSNTTTKPTKKKKKNKSKSSSSKKQSTNPPKSKSKSNHSQEQWIQMNEEVIQCGSRFVWAFVRGFAWWPAQVLLRDYDPPKEGYVFVEFFGSEQVATVKDTLEFIRPFEDGKVDSTIKKNKRKRNPKAIEVAMEEQQATRMARNDAIVEYATNAFHAANKVAQGYLGRRVEVFRSDIHYPAGCTLKGHVRNYSPTMKKWLVTYENHNDDDGGADPYYAPSWLNITAKEYAVQFLDKKSHSPSQPTHRDIGPYLFGYYSKPNDKGNHFSFLSTHCMSCLCHIHTDTDPYLQCSICDSHYHPACLDPPITNPRTLQKLLDSKEDWICDKCTPCLGCHQLDIAYGSKHHSIPSTLALEHGEKLVICSGCTPLYKHDRFCPNCGHCWDDVKYDRIQRMLKRKGNDLKLDTRSTTVEMTPTGRLLAPTSTSTTTTSSSSSSSSHQDGTPSQRIRDVEAPTYSSRLLSMGPVTRDPSWFLQDSTVWGFNESAMLVCDCCGLWVHAGCANLTREEYEQTNKGNHPVYAKEFLCRMCCKKRCITIIHQLQKEDSLLLFAVPVTEDVAPTYYDTIKHPMDLQTMMHRAEKELYFNYSWVRESFELLVLNALRFNRSTSKYWKEAQRFHKACQGKIFPKFAKAAIDTKYTSLLEDEYAKAEREVQMEIDRVKEDKSTEKKDLVGGADVVSITISPLRSEPPDPVSVVEGAEILLNPLDAHYCSWMDTCFACGSSGSSETLLFCVDCGEAFHPFCVSAPIHSMSAAAVAAWRCPNCKTCEISGELPEDETRMLYCDMCDRAFSLDLLDPPLESAPSGLWICGQCVSCTSCNNEGDGDRVSLKYWSRTPELCYRCGGCEGLVDEYTEGMNCPITCKFHRRDDVDLLKCKTCDLFVREQDDTSYIQKRDKKSETISLRSRDNNYECPRCRNKKVTKTENEILSKFFSAQTESIVWQKYQIESIGDDSEESNFDITQKMSSSLYDEIERQLHDFWRKEYLNIIDEAERIFHLLHDKHGYELTSFVESQESKMDNFLYHRTARCLRILAKAKDSKLLSNKEDDIDNVLVKAKCAAAFVKTMLAHPDLNFKSECFNWNMADGLLNPCDIAGSFVFPSASLNISGNDATTADIIENDLVQNTGGNLPQIKESDTDETRLVDSIETQAPKIGLNLLTQNALVESEICEQLQPQNISSTSIDSSKPHNIDQNEHTMNQEKKEEPMNDPKTEEISKSGETKMKNEDELPKMIKNCKINNAQVIASSLLAKPMCGWNSKLSNVQAEHKWRDPRICCFCHTCGDDDGRLSHSYNALDNGTNGSSEEQADLSKLAESGRLLPLAGGLWVHAACALWSSEVWETGFGEICAIEKARSRGSQLKCFGCGRPGATLGCHKANCPHNYHFSCAAASHCVMTVSKQMYCQKHRNNANDSLDINALGFSKKLRVISENGQNDNADDDNFAFRYGTLTVHTLGKIEQNQDGFHCKDYITPLGYTATRIFWSYRGTKKRTLYVLKVDQSPLGKPVFSITAADDANSRIQGHNMDEVYDTVMKRVRAKNLEAFHDGNMFSFLPVRRKCQTGTIFNHNAPQFFGFGISFIRKAIENLPGVEALIVPLTSSSMPYSFCYKLPSEEDVKNLQRKRARIAAEHALQNTSGSARTEGMRAVARSTGSGRITRALVRNTGEEKTFIPKKSSLSSRTRKAIDDSNNDSSYQAMYQEMKSVPLKERMSAMRSHIHGWGLFTKSKIKKDGMIIEYMGEAVRQCIADKRERSYEMSGIGSCYMFRLDLKRIVDATRIGCMARFMNHCCSPNAYAKVITVFQERGPEKKIVIFALRSIAAGEEITYDYKFPVEDGSLRCTCGAPNCIGRMN